MKIKVYPPHSDIINEELFSVLHDAYQERLEQGIDFSCSSYTLEQYKKDTDNSFLLVAYGDYDNILGSMTLTPKKAGCLFFGHTSNLAVSPVCKGKGIASALFQETINVANDNGMYFLTSTTATSAESSVRLHFKYGFKKFRYIHFSGKNYDSYYIYKTN